MQIPRETDEETRGILRRSLVASGLLDYDLNRTVFLTGPGAIGRAVITLFAEATVDDSIAAA